MTLDKNGYAPSVICEQKKCYLCGAEGDLVRHEVYHGPNRRKSKELGAWVWLCVPCHQKVHHPPKDGWNRDLWLKSNCYGLVCYAHDWNDEDFRRGFGKKY